MIEPTLALQGGTVRHDPVGTVGGSDFRVQARAALALLRDRLGHSTWLVAEPAGDQWRVVEALDDVFGFRPGHSMDWADTLCARMVTGVGPRFAPDVRDVVAYDEAPMTQTLRLGAYVGVPLVHDGAVLGTLCGFDQEPQPSRHSELPLLELLAGSLATVRWHEQRTADLVRRTARAEAEAMVDPLTQLGTRLAWNQALGEEEARCRRTGRPSCVLTVDLDGLKRTNDTYGHEAGDKLIRAAGIVLRRASRLCDHVVRLGGDEFGVLAVETDLDQASTLMNRIERALTEQGIEASIGCAERDDERGLEGAWHDADAAMYSHKRSRRRQRVSRALADPLSIVEQNGPPLELVL